MWITHIVIYVIITCSDQGIDKYCMYIVHWFTIVPRWAAMLRMIKIAQLDCVDYGMRNAHALKLLIRKTIRIILWYPPVWLCACYYTFYKGWNLYNNNITNNQNQSPKNNISKKIEIWTDDIWIIFSQTLY